MVERGENSKENTYTSNAVCVALILLGLAAAGGLTYEARQTAIKHDKAVETEEAILGKDGLLETQPLVPLSSADPSFGNIRGYFAYLNVKVDGEKTKMIEFACNIKGENQILEVPAKIVEAVQSDGDSAPEVTFNIKPEDCIDKNNITKPIISSDLNTYASLSQKIIVSLPAQDYQSFKSVK